MMPYPEGATHAYRFDTVLYAMDIWWGKTWKQVDGNWQEYRVSLAFQTQILKKGFQIKEVAKDAS